MRVVDVAASPTGAQRRSALAFVARIEHAVGSPRLSDHLRLDLGRGPADAPGPLLVTVRDQSHLIALAQVSAGNATSLLEAVTDHTIADEITVRDDALETAVDFHRRAGGDPLVWWLDDPTEHDRTVADRFGLRPWRELYEMRRSLPHPDRATVPTRDFRPGADDAAWLRINNRAFADHGEQGGWTTETLALRQAEPWFEPTGFRVHEDDGGEVDAFCWTKIHADADPVVGEIYVIAVDPSAHGRGLGRQLTLAGLDSISDRGIRVATLYVDAGNTAAVALYDRLGFAVHRRRVAFAAMEIPT